MSMVSSRIPSSLRRGLTLLFLGSLMLRMSVAWWAMPRENGAAKHDQYREYIMAGTRLLQRGALLSSLIIDDSSATSSTLMPPLYVAVVAGVYRVCGVETPMASWVLALIGASAGAFVVLGVYLIGHRLGGTRGGGTAAILTSINPMLLGYTHLVWDTCLFTLGVVATVWWSIRLGDEDGDRRWCHWVAFGAWLGILAQLNPALTVAYPLIVLWPLSRRFGWRFRQVGLGVLLVVSGWLVAITPWTVRNYRQSGELMYIRGGLGLEFWLGVCPEADTDGGAVYSQQFPLLNDEVQAHVAAIGERAYIAECRDRAWASIQADPIRYARLVGVRAVDYWLGTVYSHVSPGTSGWPRSASRAAGAAFASLELLLCFAALLVRRRLAVPARWLLGVVFIFSLVYIATHVQVRFRSPVEPLLALLLAMAWWPPPYHGVPCGSIRLKN